MPLHSGYVTMQGSGHDVTIPAGTRFTNPLGAGQLETVEVTVVPARGYVEVPLFEMASNPTVRLSEVLQRSFRPAQGPIRQAPLSEVAITADLEGVVFQIKARWTPLTQRKAREGMVRLLERRMATQPRTRYERLAADDDLF